MRHLDTAECLSKHWVCTSPVLSSSITVHVVPVWQASLWDYLGHGGQCLWPEHLCRVKWPRVWFSSDNWDSAIKTVTFTVVAATTTAKNNKHNNEQLLLRRKNKEPDHFADMKCDAAYHSDRCFAVWQYVSPNSLPLSLLKPYPWLFCWFFTQKCSVKGFFPDIVLITSR